MNNFTQSTLPATLNENGEFEDSSLDSPRSGIAELPSQLVKYARGRGRALEMAEYLGTLLAGAQPSRERQEARSARDRLCECGEWLHFRHYYTVDQVRLLGGSFCQLTKLCPLCAMRRASKEMARYYEIFVRVVFGENPLLKAYLITFTVKNGSDLKERYDHLRKAAQKLINRRRQARKGNGRGKTAFRSIHSLVGCFELTMQRNGSWHPHLHMIALSEVELQVCTRHNDKRGQNCRTCPERCQLSCEWEKTTGDSWQIDVRTLDLDKQIKSFCEVFKYSLKFKNLPLSENWLAHLILKGRRLIVSAGAFYGVPEPSIEDSDSDLAGAPYVDMFYRYLQESGVYTYDHDREREGIEADKPARPAKRDRVAARAARAEKLIVETIGPLAKPHKIVQDN